MQTTCASQSVKVVQKASKLFPNKPIKTFLFIAIKYLRNINFCPNLKRDINSQINYCLVNIQNIKILIDDLLKIIIR